MAAYEFRFSRLDKSIPRSREAKIRCLLQYYVAIHRMMMPEILNQRPLSFMQRVFRSRHTYPTLWCIQVPQALDFAGTICFHHSSCTTHLTHLGKNKLFQEACSLYCSICLPARNGSQASTPAQTCAHHVEFCASILLASIDGASKNYAASCKRSLLKSRPD